MLSDYLNYLFVPRFVCRLRREKIIEGLSDEEKTQLEARVSYYNKLTTHVGITGGANVGQYHFPWKKHDVGIKKTRLSTYFFDQYNVMRFFPSRYWFLYRHGDITEVPALPTFVKSRPIDVDNANAVLLKLNSRRHFKFVDDRIPFSEKKNMLVWRGTWCNARPWRRRFCEMFFDDPMCNVGKTKPEKDEAFPQSIKGYMSKHEQLRYKFIACIEGIDVATNLKWVMSSNSIAVSPPMHYETWFMEGRLRADYHYIEVKPDYSDLKDKLHYYIDHPLAAEAIIRHAHEWVRQFQNRHFELATQLAVAKKYFALTQTE